MISRIETAASRVCGGVPDIRDLDRQPIYRACVKQAMDDCVARLHQPMVYVLYYGKPLSQVTARK